MNLQQLKQKNPAELIIEAEKLGIENPRQALFTFIGENCHFKGFYL